MGIIALIFLPVSLVFAIISMMTGKKKSDLFGVFSLVFCAIPPIVSIFDINARIAHNDIAGIMDTYPTMGVIFALVLIMVTVINGIRVVKQNHT